MGAPGRLSPVAADLLLDRSTDEWDFKRDARIRVPWANALHTVGGVPFLRPELALLHKAHLDRPKDRADLAAACLDPAAATWLAATLDQLGHDSWAQLVRAQLTAPACSLLPILDLVTAYRTLLLTEATKSGTGPQPGAATQLRGDAA